VKRLALLRHAAADAPRAGQPDIERSLSAQGREEALAAAQCIERSRLRIEALIASPAQRARETATLVAAQLDISSAVTFEAELYLGKPDALLQVLQHCAPGISTVLMIGHNPGLSELAQRFHHSKPAVELRTAGLCCIEFGADVSWSELRPELSTGFQILR
jgi:phosphohistidine phosphatase